MMALEEKKKVEKKKQAEEKKGIKEMIHDHLMEQSKIVPFGLNDKKISITIVFSTMMINKMSVLIAFCLAKI